MTPRVVKTQAELHAALADSSVAVIEIRSEPGVWLSLSQSDSATVRAYDSATVEAYGSATVRAYDSATVEAYGSATVWAYGSATVRAYGSATVEAYDSATVWAHGSATVRNWNHSKTIATPHVAVHLHSASATVEGGVVIDVTDVNSTTEKWLEHHGVENDDGAAVLFKAVDDEWTTPRRFDYSPGATVEAPDWRADAMCGGGLHLSPRPHQAKAYHAGATRFVACRVNVADLVVIPGGSAAKCKVPSCVVLHEVDIDGEAVAS